jgi:hypothetical protein
MTLVSITTILALVKDLYNFIEVIPSLYTTTQIPQLIIYTLCCALFICDILDRLTLHKGYRTNAVSWQQSPFRVVQDQFFEPADNFCHVKRCGSIPKSL